MKTAQNVCPKCGNTEINENMKKCPNCGKKLGTPVYKKWWFWVIIVVGVLIIAGAGATTEDEPEYESPSSSVSTTTTTERQTTAVESSGKNYIKVDLQKMMDDLDENALKAEKTYNNAYIEVTGKIAGFDSDGSYITIEPVNASEWNLDTVTCYIKDKEQLDILLEKAKGDKITIQGKITSVGEFLGYSLKIDAIK